MKKSGERARDAITGRLVTLEEARRRPDTTVVETFKKDKDGRPLN